MSHASQEMWHCADCNLRNSAKANKCFACFADNPVAPKPVITDTATKDKTVDEPEKKTEETETKQDEETKEWEENYASREPHLRPIFFKIPLDTRPFGLALCKKFQEKFLCVVVPESKSGQQGVMVGTEVLAIDHFLLDSNNWKYVNKFWEGCGFYFMPMFDKVAYLRTKDNIEEKPIILYCKYDPMQVLSMGRHKSPDADAEPCQWWDALLSDTYRWAVEQKPEIWNVVGDYNVEVLNLLPLQCEPKKTHKSDKEEETLKSASDDSDADDEPKPGFNRNRSIPLEPKSDKPKDASPTMQALKNKEESELIDTVQSSGSGDLDALTMLQQAHRTSLPGLKLDEKQSNESPTKAQPVTGSNAAIQSLAGSSGSSSWKPPKMIARPSVREAASASTDDSDFDSAGDHPSGAAIVTELPPGEQLKVYAKAGAYIQIREPVMGWIKYKESQSEVFVKKDETLSTDADESKVDETKVIPKDFSAIVHTEELKGDCRLRMENEYISRYDSAPDPILDNEDEDHETDEDIPSHPQYWLSKLLKPDMVNVVYLMSDMNLGNAPQVQHAQMIALNALYEKYNQKTHFIVIRVCLVNMPNSEAATAVPSEIESANMVLCRGSIRILNAYGLNSFGTDFFKGAFLVIDSSGKVVADPRTTLNMEFDDESSLQRLTALIES